MSEPTVNHHVKDRNAIELTNRALPHLSATLAKGLQAVKNRENCEVYPSHVSRPSYSFASAFGTVLSPRWRNIETLPFPLSAMANPGSSIPAVVTRKDEMAKGPGLVR